MPLAPEDNFGTSDHPLCWWCWQDEGIGMELGILPGRAIEKDALVGEFIMWLVNGTATMATSPYLIYTKLREKLT